MTETLRDMHALDGLAADVARLRRHMPPPSSFGLHVAPPAGARTMSAEEVLRPHALRMFLVGALSDLTDAPEAKDQRIAAQRFIKKYSAAVLPAALLTLAGGVALDVSLDRLRFVVEDGMFSGLVLVSVDARTCAARAPAWPLDAARVASLDELRAHALESLLYGNLVPAVDAVLRVQHLSRRMLWCGISEQVDLFYAGARLAGVGDAAALAADREVVLNAETLPVSGRPNPNHGTFHLEHDPGLDRLFMVRAVCCMQFRLRDDARYCTNCGLPTPEQRGLLRLRSAEAGNDPRIPPR